MVAKVVDDQVIIDEESEANQNYNKGYFGVLKGGILTLNLIEATFLVEMGRIEIQDGENKFSLPCLMDFGIATHENFEIRYLVYRDIRRRGYVIRPGKHHLFDLFPRGESHLSRHPGYEVRAISERSQFSIDDVISWVQEAKTEKKKLLLGLVDEEGDLTYYIVQIFQPKGAMTETVITGGTGTLLNDRVMVWDTELCRELQNRAIGRNFADNGAVQLSLLETAYLMEEKLKLLRGKNEMSYQEFMKYALEIQPDIHLRLRTYKDLREKGMIAKTGFKFGSHFRVYKGKGIEGHAPFLVHVVRKGFTSTWTEVSRAVRLAHSVRKQMLFCRSGKKIEYVKIRRITP